MLPDINKNTGMSLQDIEKEFDKIPLEIKQKRIKDLSEKLNEIKDPINPSKLLKSLMHVEILDELGNYSQDYEITVQCPFSKNILSFKLRKENVILFSIDKENYYQWKDTDENYQFIFKNGFNNISDKDKIISIKFIDAISNLLLHYGNIYFRNLERF